MTNYSTLAKLSHIVKDCIHSYPTCHKTVRDQNPSVTEIELNIIILMARCDDYVDCLYEAINVYSQHEGDTKTVTSSKRYLKAFRSALFNLDFDSAFGSICYCKQYLTDMGAVNIYALELCEMITFICTRIEELNHYRQVK